jgi:hypothetical protein
MIIDLLLTMTRRTDVLTSDYKMHSLVSGGMRGKGINELRRKTDADGRDLRGKRRQESVVETFSPA